MRANQGKSALTRRAQKDRLLVKSSGREGGPEIEDVWASVQRRWGGRRIRTEWGSLEYIKVDLVTRRWIWEQNIRILIKLDEIGNSLRGENVGAKMEAQGKADTGRETWREEGDEDVWGCERNKDDIWTYMRACPTTHSNISTMWICVIGYLCARVCLYHYACVSVCVCPSYIT